VGINLLNATFRKKDMEENPQYYTDDALKSIETEFSDVDWGDADAVKTYLKGLKGLTMADNTIGHKTHLFIGRYEDGTEKNLRWGKQFRELFELIMDKAGVSWPRPMLKKIGGKAAPQAQLIAQAFTGKTLSGYENYDLKYKEGWDYTIGLMKTIAKAGLPYSSANIFREDKEFRPTDLFAPSSKGMTPSQAEDLFFKGIHAQDPQFVSEVYEGAVRNGLDAYSLFGVAMRRHNITLDRDYKAVGDEIDEIKAKMKASDNPKEKMALLDKLTDLQVKETDIKISRKFHDIAMAEMKVYTSQYNKKWGPPETEDNLSKGE